MSNFIRKITRNQLKEIYEEKCKEIERLKQRLKTSNDTCNYLRNTVDKAIEYIEKNYNKEPWATVDGKDLLKILKGEIK